MKKSFLITTSLVICGFIAGFFSKNIGEYIFAFKNNMFPSSCRVNNIVYKSGEIIQLDVCNSCTCENGQISCTSIACNDQNQNQPDDTNQTHKTDPLHCYYNGSSYRNGESFPGIDGCNTCTCNNGIAGCTKKACFNPVLDISPYPKNQTCTYNGKIFKDGDSFAANDNCNSCSCTTGQINCTSMACAQ